MGIAYYNELDPYCAQWLRNLIEAGHLPLGDVDERDIRKVMPDDLKTYGQIHLFAGIGGIPLGLRLAGWPEQTVDVGDNLLQDGDGGVAMPRGRTQDPKYDGAVALYEKGFSIADCAAYYGITRQAMHKILQRRETAFRENLRYGDDNHFHRGGARMSKRAGHLVEKALKKGVLVPEPCEVCGATGIMADGRSLVQAHHDDYSRPLAVRWLCQEHHHEWHKHNRAKGEQGEPAAVGVILTGGFP